MGYSRLGNFFADKRGQFAIIAAVATIPLAAAIGIALDFSRLSNTKSDLQQAADSAALAAVSRSGETYKNGGVFNLTWSKGRAKKEANSWFNANQQANADYFLKKVDIDVDRSGPNLTSNVDVTARVKTTFMGIVGITDQEIRIHSTATSALAPYLDVHVLTDNSPSMALGATPGAIAELKSLTGLRVCLPQFKRPKQQLLGCCRQQDSTAH
jgi:Flp pilus assembly protein TadG